MIYAIINTDGLVIDTIVAEASFEPRIREIFKGYKIKVSDESKESKTAAVGRYYIEGSDYFTPYKSWTIDKDGEYEQKKLEPKDTDQYRWNEQLKTWEKLDKIKKPIKK